MKLCCVLFSLAVVKVLAEKIVDYKTKAVITNELLRQACDITAGFPTIIKRIVLGNQYSMDYADTEGLNIFQCMKYERDVQEAIFEGINSLDDEYKEVPKIDAAKIPDPLIRNASLKDIGYSRRSMTKIHLKHLLSRVERRKEESFTAVHVCYLIGLYKNSTIPRFGTLPFIKTAKVDDDGTCILTSSEDDVTYYKHYMFDIFQFRPDIQKEEVLLNQD
ncbi:uncharacterized protein LOC126840135 isoform X2 [Adelges cooleyi]|uniref:uncharacterized protein LOC126840135 isoform X2 n=1 Tax=Adelges cooleyi TaxID=133065 RepID=UPI002180300E|nr:uncharacterized protein LOC126840135 isoform X2 [Adelges cooleyi]